MKPEIPRLLAGRDRLSRPEKEEILEAVLAGVAPARSTRWWWLTAPAVVAAAAVTLLVAAPWRESGPRDELAARGGGTPSAALKLHCAEACTTGAKLLFDLDGTSGYRYFAAFARRGDGVVLWYFPDTPEGTSVDLDAAKTSGVLDRSIVLGGEHTPGRYQIYGVFSQAPLTRAQLHEAFTGDSAGPGTAVVAQELDVR